jgi:imidazoleglycerol phosphate synthase glutamine amidotransferase subunit HisH
MNNVNVIDHGTGNITSINNLLDSVEAKHQIASSPRSLDIQNFFNPIICL